GGETGETTQERQNAVWARFRARGGQSNAYYESVYEAFGFTVQVRDARAYMADVSDGGDSLFTSTWEFVFVVSTYDVVANKPRFEALMDRLVPAHAVVLFSYI
ncbi:MAG: DUF2313 domain-containing protein, partial [Gammaproteobacteria bacterium]|nr:DUF2313 domain-containing protein [Gammaproteobacteria bacterium]